MRSIISGWTNARLYQGSWTYNDWNSSNQVLASSEEGSHKQNDDGDRNCGKRKREFQRLRINDNDHKLHRKSEEKEEVKLEQCDVNLSYQSA